MPLSASELIERCGLAGGTLGSSQLRALPSTWNRVQYPRQLAAVRLGSIKHACQQRASECIAINCYPFSHACQPGIVIVVQHDSQGMNMGHDRHGSQPVRIDAAGSASREAQEPAR